MYKISNDYDVYLKQDIVCQYTEISKKADLPTDSMRKSKLSSEASFLLDFSLPCRFTIFTNS